MKRLSLSVVASALIFLAFVPAASQTSTIDGTEKANKYKWEIGYDVLPFLRNPQIGSFGLLARKHYAPDKALRLSADLGFRSDRIKNTNVLANKGTNQSYSFFIGHEWQKHHDKFVVYYGVDIAMAINFNRNNSPQTTPDSTNASINVIGRSTLLTAGPRGFFGVKYFIIPSLSISAETSLNYHFQYNYMRERRFYNAGVFVYETTSEQTFHSVSFSPLSVIYISYHF